MIAKGATHCEHDKKLRGAIKMINKYEAENKQKLSHIRHTSMDY